MIRFYILFTTFLATTGYFTFEFLNQSGLSNGYYALISQKLMTANMRDTMPYLAQVASVVYSVALVWTPVFLLCLMIIRIREAGLDRIPTEKHRIIKVLRSVRTALLTLGFITLTGGAGVLHLVKNPQYTELLQFIFGMTLFLSIVPLGIGSIVNAIIIYLKRSYRYSEKQKGVSNGILGILAAICVGAYTPYVYTQLSNMEASNGTIKVHHIIATLYEHFGKNGVVIGLAVVTVFMLGYGVSELFKASRLGSTPVNPT